MDLNEVLSVQILGFRGGLLQCFFQMQLVRGLCMHGTLYKTIIFRYVYDTVTQEFVNIGVAICAPETNYVKARFNPDCRRVSQFFQPIDTNFYRILIQSIQTQLQQQWQKNEQSQEKPIDIELLMAQVMPRDDSSLVYAILGGGRSKDLDGELARLYQRYVTRYDKPEFSESCADDGTQGIEATKARNARLPHSGASDSETVQRFSCRQLLALLPAAGLTEAQATLSDLLRFYQERQLTHTTPVPETTIIHGVIVEPINRPSFSLTDDDF